MGAPDRGGGVPAGGQGQPGRGAAGGLQAGSAPSGDLHPNWSRGQPVNRPQPLAQANHAPDQGGSPHWGQGQPRLGAAKGWQASHTLNWGGGPCWGGGADLGEGPWWFWSLVIPVVMLMVAGHLLYRMSRIGNPKEQKIDLWLLERRWGKRGLNASGYRVSL